MNRISVALFTQRSHAEPLQQRLLSSGIAAEIREELLIQKLWFVSKQAAGVRLEVPAEQFEKAQQLLRAWDAAGDLLCHAIRCPECKSLLVDYPQYAHHSVLTNMAAGLAAEVGLVEKDYYCERCHYTWPKEPSSPKRQRPHMAPNYFIEGIQPQSTSPSSGKTVSGTPLRPS